MAALSRAVRLTTGLVTLLLPALQPLVQLIRNQVSANRFDRARAPEARAKDLVADELDKVWAVPISLATTFGIEVSFFSCRY
jgi:hypothetical protein